MKKWHIEQKLENFCSFLTILILLPYVASVFINGANFAADKQNEKYVQVTRHGHEQEVIEVPWSEYFLGVLTKEMPESYEVETLKVQAVLIRTKLYQMLEENPEEILTESFLSRKELEDKWGSEYEANYLRLSQAIADTDNQVVFYQETYAWVPFYQSGNGFTRSAAEVLGSDEYPYLTVLECPADKEARDAMHIYTFEYTDVINRCRPFLVAVDEENANKRYDFADFEILARDSAGYVSQIRIGETICTGDRFRDALSLPSAAFSLKDDEGKLKITTIGRGHGLGLSQWTANQMAQNGSNYEEILQFFYPGTNLVETEEIFEKIARKKNK